jgi:enoyl-CoA hydratase
METVQIDRYDDEIALVTLDRPDRLNAMSHALVSELYETLASLANDRTCRVVVLTGAGRGFCAGLDLRDPGEAPGSHNMGMAQAGMVSQQHIARLIPLMREMPQPVIAAVNGPAAGGGLALALASDIRIAGSSARFNVAFVRIGLSGCDIGVSWLLPRLVGAARAFEMMLTGRIIDAHEADRIGLVLKVVADGDVVNAAIETAKLICANSPFGVWMTKEVMWSNLETSSLHAAIDLENRTQILTTMTEDTNEAMAAWVQKRNPLFHNR